MLKPEDFEIPLEKQLKLRMMYDEIENCDDRDALKENLKLIVEQNARFQHLLGKILQDKLHDELNKWITNVEQEASQNSNNPLLYYNGG